jgi:hypothetical protein
MNVRFLRAQGPPKYVVRVSHRVFVKLYTSKKGLTWTLKYVLHRSLENTCALYSGQYTSHTGRT